MTRVGFQTRELTLVSEDISATLATDPCTCPYAYMGCYGAKDSEFEGRCSGRDLPYLTKCRLYQINEGLIETSRVKKRLPKTKHSPDGDSVEDAIANGADPLKLVGIGMSALRNSREYDSTRNTLWPIWQFQDLRLMRG
jgi:hypothetical protein